MRTHALALLMVSALTFAVPELAWAAPSMLPSDDRIKIIRYDENDVYTITTKFGYQTNIVFASGESIDTVSVGDRSLWQIIPSGNRLFIRPMQQGISTNMTVLTNKRPYQFDLKSLSTEEKEDKAIYVAKFIYAGNPLYDRPPMPPIPASPPPIAEMPPPPPPSLPAVEAPSMPPSSLATKPLPSAVYTNYNYTYSGPDELAPLQVFDNGNTTFIKYVELPSPLPNIYTIGADGKRTLVSAEIKNTMLAVHAIVGRIELEHTGGTIIVYNEMLNPGH